MGRRWGKTIMAGSVALACASEGASVAWVVPSYRNSRPVWRFVEQHAAGHADLLRGDRIARFKRGWLGVYTADNDVSIRGESFDLVVIDEAAQIKHETWTDAIMPTLADRNGKAMLISTPKGKNWFYAEWLRGKADGKEVMAFNAPSSANPMPQIQAAARKAKDIVSERTYRQEWLAEFVEDGTGVFRRARECANAAPQSKAIKGHEYIVGVDWGRTNDATVFCVIDTISRECVYIDRMTQTDYQTQMSRLIALNDLFKPAVILAELNSMGAPMVERAQLNALPVQGFTTTNATKSQIIDALALAFERGDISIIPDETLIAELQAYESERLPSGLVRYGAPHGLHDDGVIALALAWHAASNSGASAVLI